MPHSIGGEWEWRATIGQVGAQVAHGFAAHMASSLYDHQSKQVTDIIYSGPGRSAALQNVSLTFWAARLAGGGLTGADSHLAEPHEGCRGVIASCMEPIAAA